MEHSLFYIAGGALIVVALILSLLGMRSDKFPSGSLFKAGMLVVALLVAATAYGAIELAQEEQATRLEEANLEADAQQAEQNVVNQQTGDTADPTPANDGAGQLDGAAVFVDTGCGSCHILADLGADAQGTIGPDLDEGLADLDEAAIEEAIVDPGAEIPPGFSDDVMPADYKEQLTPPELTALVTYLWETAGLEN
jgi:mono/diheme cytochrome c family protein